MLLNKTTFQHEPDKVFFIYSITFCKTLEFTYKIENKTSDTICEKNILIFTLLFLTFDLKRVRKVLI